MGAGAGVSGVQGDEVQRLREEVDLLRSVLARVVIAQAKSDNALAAYLWTQRPNALLSNPFSPQFTAADEARNQILDSSKTTLDLISEIVDRNDG